MSTYKQLGIPVWAALAIIVSVCAGLFACVTPSYAAGNVEAWGAQAALSEQDLAKETVQVDTLVLSGVPGDTVFLTVKDDGKVVAKNLPHVIGEGDNQTGDASDGESADVFELEIPQANVEDRLSKGAYSVEAYESRTGGSPLYSGTVWGVYAQLKNGDITTRQLIGAVTGATAFNAPDKLYANGVSYKLVSANPQTASGSGVLEFEYESYDESTTVDGVVKYVDAAGNALTSTAIPGIPYDEGGEGVTVKIPAAIIANGKVYRTIYHSDSVTAKNPGQSTFVVPCAPLSDAASDAAGHYLAVINFVADDETIATDTVNVTGTYYYNAPTTIYKTETVDGDQRVKTYRIQGKSLQILEPSTDPAIVDPTTHTRVVNVPYEADELEPAEVKVTFNLIDGQKRASSGDAPRLLGTETVKVSAQNPTVQPKPQITVDGKTYNLAGSAESYTYTYGSGEVPVVNAYYVPDGYQPPEAYTVTVNYVNCVTGETVASGTFTSSPDELSDMRIETPERFVESGVTYVRLAGQEAPIAHSFWSHNDTYTVYYRDENDTLTTGTTITHVRVVYDDVVTTTTTTTTTTGRTTTTGTTGATGAAGATGGTTGAGATATNPGQMRTTGTYDVNDGTGNRRITNERGADTNTERIADDQTPLAQDAGEAPAAAQDGGLLIGLIAALIVAAIGLLVWLLLKRRREDEDEQPMQA